MKLLLAAFPPELGPLVAGPPEGWRCACTGVGALSAAAATARMIAEERPAKVVFIGTCGAYDPGLPLGSCFSARQVIATSLAEVREEAYRPEIETSRWTSTIAIPFPPCDIVVPPAITRSLEGARELASLGPLEHLELGGVFEACRQANLPCGAALVVVNAVGPEAHAQWRAHHAEGSQRLIAALLDSGFFERE